MTAFRDLIKRSGPAAQLLVLLVQNMNDTNAVVMSQRTLAELMGCSARSIRDYVKILSEERWINILKIGTSNVYHINRECFWQQGRNKKHYAQLTASVVLTESEQQESIEELRKPHPVRQIPRADEVGSLTLLDDEDPPSQGEMEFIVDEQGRKWEVNPETGEAQAVMPLEPPESE